MWEDRDGVRLFKSTLESPGLALAGPRGSLASLGGGRQATMTPRAPTPALNQSASFPAPSSAGEGEGQRAPPSAVFRRVPLSGAVTGVKRGIFGRWLREG